MTKETFSLLLDIGIFLAGGLLLLAVLKGMEWLVDLLPMNRGRREAFARVMPVAAAIFTLGYVILAAQNIVGKRLGYEPIIAGVILLAALAAVWPTLREGVAGVFVKAARVCKVGDAVRVDGVQGTVQRMGLLVIAVKTPRGEEAIVPYSRVRGALLVRTAVQDKLAAYSFSLRMPDEIGVAQARALIRNATLRCHWSAFHREPEVAHMGDGTYEVTAYALHAERGPDIEQTVRQELLASKVRSLSRTLVGEEAPVAKPPKEHQGTP